LRKGFTVTAYMTILEIDNPPEKSPKACRRSDEIQKVKGCKKDLRRIHCEVPTNPLLSRGQPLLIFTISKHRTNVIRTTASGWSLNFRKMVSETV
jgi:hypothetical protein